MPRSPCNLVLRWHDRMVDMGLAVDMVIVTALAAAMYLAVVTVLVTTAVTSVSGIVTTSSHTYRFTRTATGMTTMGAMDADTLIITVLIIMDTDIDVGSSAVARAL